MRINVAVMNSWFVFILLVATVLIQLFFVNHLLVGLEWTVIIGFWLVLLLAGCLFSLLCRPVCRLLTRPIAPPAWLIPLSRQLAVRMNIATPDVHLLALSGINAFAMDALFQRGQVLLNQVVLTQLNQDEVEAVLAHEMSHIASRHALVITVIQGMTLTITFVPVFVISLFYALIYGLDKLRLAFLTLNHLVSVILFPLTSISIALLSRRWELAADRIAAGVIGRDKYIRALRCLHASFFQPPDPLNSAMRKNQSERSPDWALSHPSLSRRINALLEVGL